MGPVPKLRNPPPCLTWEVFESRKFLILKQNQWLGLDSRKCLMIFNYYIAVIIFLIFWHLIYFWNLSYIFLNESFIGSAKLIIWSKIWNICFSQYPRIQNWVGKIIIFFHWPWPPSEISLGNFWILGGTSLRGGGGGHWLFFCKFFNLLDLCDRSLFILTTPPMP